MIDEAVNLYHELHLNPWTKNLKIWIEIILT